MTESKSNKRVALVTGSTSGIGLAIAKRLAEDGFIIAFHRTGVSRDSNEPELDNGTKALGGAIADGTGSATGRDRAGGFYACC